MDSEDIQILESLAKIGRNPALVTNYSLHRQGKNGDYMARVEIHDAGSGAHRRFTCVAWREKTPAKAISSNQFENADDAILGLHWSELD
jgi:hypothetical protein